MKITKTVSAVLTAFALTAASASADCTQRIKDVSMSGNTLTGAQVSIGEYESADFYAAVYEKGMLKAVEKVKVTEDGDIDLNSGITYDSKNQTLKCFLWNGMEAISTVYYGADGGTGTEGDTDTDGGEETGYTVKFETDEHCSVTVSKTQSFDGDVTENAQTAIARNSDTGEIDASGEGQVNFMAVLEEGYCVDSVTVSPKNYKNLKTPADTGIENVYRITKITGDITVTVKTKEISDEDKEPSETTGDTVIHLLGSSADAGGAENVTIDGAAVTITAAGEYTLDGTLDDGQIIVGAPKDSLVTVNLNGVSVTSSTGEAFTASNGKITLSATGENTFISTAASANGIYSRQDLTLDGGGKINVKSNGNGIRCKKDLTIGECDLDVNAGNNGIKGDKSVKVTKNNKSVTVVSGKDGISSDLTPSIDSDTNEYVSGGTVKINGGTIDITANSVTDTETGTISTGDGIQADTMLTIQGGTINIKADGEGLKANASSAADGTPAEGDGCIEISGGTVTVESAGEDGIKAVKNVTVSGGEITVNAKQEGIQVKEIIYDTDGTSILKCICGEIDIKGGTIDITSGEDGIQCGTGNIVISDGEITVKSQNDGIQAEDLLYITDGTINITAHDGVSGSKTEDSCKGLKSGNLIYITGGDIKINSYDDAIHSNHTVRILGDSRIEAATTDDGVHGDYFLFIGGDAYINITESYEGIEATVIYVEGGETYVVSSDDGANAAGDYSDYNISNAYDISNYYDAELSSVGEATLLAGGNQNGQSGNKGNNGENTGNGGSGNKGPDSQGGMDDNSKYGYLNITGGFLYLVADGDVIDSNGSAVMSGGVVMANGPSKNNSNSMFDYDGTFNVKGGTLVGVGIQQTNMDKYPTVSNQGYYSASKTGKAGDKLKITIGSKNLIIIPATAYQNVFVSTPDMSGTNYSISTVSSYSGGDELLGITNNGTFYGLIENVN